VIRWVSVLAVSLAAEAAAVCPIVDTASDALVAPAGSLRECMELANVNPALRTITFVPSVFASRAIILAGALPAVTAPVRIEGPPGLRVIINGAATQDVTGFDVRSDDVSLVRLEVRNFRGGGGYGAGTAVFFHSVSRGRIEDCTISNNQGGGVLFEGSGGGHRITGSTISENDIAGIRWYGPGSCQTTRSAITDNVFRGNNVGNTSADDIAITFTGCIDVVGNTFEQNRYFGIRLTGASSNVLIAGNELSNATVGFFSGSRNNEVRGNRFVHDAGDALVIGDGNGSIDNRVVGNLFLGSTSAERALSVYNLSSTTRLFHNTVLGYRSTGIVVDELQAVDVRNNLFVDMPSAVTGPLGAGSTVESNGVFSVATPCAACDAGGWWVGDPGFVAPPGNLQLQSCRAGAIDRGVDLGALQPARAADGGRFWGLAPDLGAFETACAARVDDDAGVLDGGLIGAGVSDGGVPDAGADAGVDDAGIVVVGVVDAGVDAGGPDAGSPAVATRLLVGCGCSSDGSFALVVLALFALMRARPRRQP